MALYDEGAYLFDKLVYIQWHRVAAHILIETIHHHLD